MNQRPWLLLGVAVAAVLLVGCGPKAASEAGHAHSEETESAEGGTGGVTFKAGRGLTLPPEVIKALGLITAEAEERALATQVTLTAQIFALTPTVQANARVPAAQADALEKAGLTGAQRLRMDRSTASATGLVDLVFDLNPGPHQIGDFVPLTLTTTPNTVLTVPRSAVLDGATGTFVYVLNSGAYLRTPVTLGARSADVVEIVDGLYAGDVVVTTSVDQLWLAELRLTKGGGHSH